MSKQKGERPPGGSERSLVLRRVTAGRRVSHPLRGQDSASTGWFLSLGRRAEAAPPQAGCPVLRRGRAERGLAQGHLFPERAGLGWVLRKCSRNDRMKGPPPPPGEAASGRGTLPAPVNVCSSFIAGTGVGLPQSRPRGTLPSGSLRGARAQEAGTAGTGRRTAAGCSAGALGSVLTVLPEHPLARRVKENV